MSLDSLRNRHSESNRIKLLESPLNALGKKKFKISDVLNVKLRPIRSRNSNGSKKLDSDVRGVKEVKNNGRQMPVNSYIAQSMRVPPISLHSALKAALAKKFDKAVTDSSARVEEAEAESPMSQW